MNASQQKEKTIKKLWGLSALEIAAPVLGAVMCCVASYMLSQKTPIHDWETLKLPLFDLVGASSLCCFPWATARDLKNTRSEFSKLYFNKCASIVTKDLFRTNITQPIEKGVRSTLHFLSYGAVIFSSMCGVYSSIVYELIKKGATAPEIFSSPDTVMAFGMTISAAGLIYTKRKIDRSLALIQG